MTDPNHQTIHGRSLRVAFSSLYEELRRHAVALAGRGQWPTGGPTDLVSEATLKLLESAGGEKRPVDELYAMIPSIMRSILVDRARMRGALKREAFGRAHSTDALLDEVGARSTEVGAGDLEDLDDALRELSVCRPTSAQVIEARIFSGLSNEDTARLLGIGTVAATMHWTEGLRFLRRRFGMETSSEEGIWPNP